jgi:hypothetical protein
LRKYLIVAIVAMTAMAFATVALAQSGDTATMTTKLTPKNAGTKRKPTNSKLDLNIVNSNVRRTMSDLDIYMPKTLKISLKGMPTCSGEDIRARACPKSSILGRGDAKAKAGVNGDPAKVTDLTFDVKAVKTASQVSGKPMLGFIIDDGGGLLFLAETKLSKAGGKFGQKLHIDVPELAQHVGTAYNGLVSLHTILGKKKGNNKLLATTGCKNKKQPFKVVLTFIDNEVTTHTKYGDTSSSKCTK